MIVMILIGIQCHIILWYKYGAWVWVGDDSSQYPPVGPGGSSSHLLTPIITKGVW